MDIEALSHMFRTGFLGVKPTSGVAIFRERERPLHWAAIIALNEAECGSRRSREEYWEGAGIIKK